MSPQQFQSDEHESAGRAEQELRAATLGLPERLKPDPQPSLADVAEGLDITLDEARALLSEVRVRRLRKARPAVAPPIPRFVCQPPRPATRGVGALGALIALWLLIACAFGHAIAAAL